MFARWVTRCFWVKDKRKRHPSGPVGPSQTNPSKSGECHQQELHGSTAKHCHFHIHTLTRNQKDWECWWMSVWTAYNTVNHLLDRHGTAGSHSWKSTNLGMCVTGLRDRQAQNVSLENCMWLSVVYSCLLWEMNLKVHQHVVPNGILRPNSIHFEERYFCGNHDTFVSRIFDEY